MQCWNLLSDGSAALHRLPKWHIHINRGQHIMSGVPGWGRDRNQRGSIVTGMHVYVQKNLLLLMLYFYFISYSVSHMILRIELVMSV